jgi:hypothetical protein
MKLRCVIFFCRLPLGNGQEGDKENRQRENPFKGKALYSDTWQPLAGNLIDFKKVVT